MHRESATARVRKKDRLDPRTRVTALKSVHGSGPENRLHDIRLQLRERTREPRRERTRGPCMGADPRTAQGADPRTAQGADPRTVHGSGPNHPRRK